MIATYLIILALWSAYCIRSLVSNYTKTAFRDKVKIICISPLTLLYYPYLWLAKPFENEETKDKSLLPAVKYLESELHFWFPKKLHRKSFPSVVLYRTLRFDLDKDIVGSPINAFLSILENVKLWSPLNRQSVLLGQHIVFRLYDSKLLSSFSSRTRGKNTLYYRFKVCMGKITIYRDEYVNKEGSNCNAFISGFAGESLERKREVLFRGFVLTKSKRVEVLNRLCKKHKIKLEKGDSIEKPIYTHIYWR